MTLIRFLIVGVANTIVGLGTILLLQEVVGVPYRWANVSGYAVGLVNSFLWNKFWTFQSPGWQKTELYRFFFVFLISFGVQFAVLHITIEQLGLVDHLGQLVAIVFYTMLNYTLNRLWTFKT